MSNEKKKDPFVVSLLRLSTRCYSFIFLDSPRVAREYVGETYGLEYYYCHPPILFLSSFFLFHFPFSFFFRFLLLFNLLYQLPSMGSICPFVEIYSYEILFRRTY
jgi:hypothetical protein